MPVIRTVLRYAALLAILIAAATALTSADILDDWDTAKAPAKPEIKAVTVDPSTTALLILDLMKSNCGQRPRCVATVPNVKRLHDAARASGMSSYFVKPVSPRKLAEALSSIRA